MIKETTKFLGKDVLSENKMKTLEKHLSFASMKANPAVNKEEAFKRTGIFKLIEREGKFMRNGQLNQWREHMSKEMVNRFDSWTEEMCSTHNL